MPSSHLFLKKGKSSINGVGIFTEKLIEKGKVFYTVPLDVVSNTPGPGLAHIGRGLYVNDDTVLNWVNHSCDPNTALDISTDQPSLKSIKDILPGEEITCDYNKTEKGDVEEVKCNCGSANCRGFFLRIKL